MDDAPYGGGRFVIDNSAFVRAGREAVREEYGQALLNDQILVTSGFLYEVLYSARNADDYEEVREELLGGFELVVFDGEVWDAALEAQRQLAMHAGGYHRGFSAVDLLTAAAASRNGVGVLHYDSDFDDIRNHSGLEFESRWIAPAGTLDEDRPLTPLKDSRRKFQQRVNAIDEAERAEMYDHLCAVIDRRSGGATA
jgi:predicted nucleic acid-binding protein